MELSVAQTTAANPATCTYSFVVPQVDLLSTCQSITDHRVDDMQKIISELQNKVHNLQTGKPTTTSTTPTFTCGCANNTSVQFVYRG